MAQNRTWITLSCLFGIAVAAGGCGRHTAAAEGEGAGKPGEQAAVAVEMAVALVRPMHASIHARGTFAPPQGASARVAPVAAGRVAEVRVREGDRVAAGQVIAVIEGSAQRAQAASSAAALTAAERQAASADLGAAAAAVDQRGSVRLAGLALDAAKLDRDTSIRQARIALDAARADLRKLEAGSRPQEIAQANQGVVQARAARDRAQSEMQRSQLLFDRGIIAKRQLEDARTALELAASALVSAQQQASLVSAGSRPEDLQAGRLRVDAASESLDQAARSGDARVDQARAALRQAEQAALQVDARRQDAVAAHAAAAQKRADLAASRASLATAELRSPIAGVVTHRFLNPGDMADTATPVLEVAAVRSLDLICGVPVDEGARVMPGMSARIHAGEGSGGAVAGRVTAVGQVDPQTNLMAIRIAAPNTAGTLRAGEFASADIILRTDTHAVAVPAEAIVQHEGKSSLFIVSADGVAHRKDVEVGAEEAGFVQVPAGVHPGDRVVKLGQFELADGAKVTEARSEPPAEGKE